jgi:hypothetical protein
VWKWPGLETGHFSSLRLQWRRTSFCTSFSVRDQFSELTTNIAIGPRSTSAPVDVDLVYTHDSDRTDVRNAGLKS